MTNLFSKETGLATSFTSTKIVDSTKTWKTNQFQNWFVAINSQDYQIVSNNSNELIFNNNLTISSNLNYTISFVNRARLSEVESDSLDTIKIPDDLINKKYNQANNDISTKIFANLRSFTKTDFNPLNNIANLYAMQQVFCYFVLAKIFQDLSINQDSFEAFKGYNMYEKSYNDNIKDAIALLQIDFDQSGTIDVNEQNKPSSNTAFFSR